jgi:hypothetical protein
VRCGVIIGVMGPLFRGGESITPLPPEQTAYALIDNTTQDLVNLAL